MTNSLSDAFQQRSFAHLIDGRLQPSEYHFDVINPSSGKPFAQCPNASQEQFEQSVAAARRAFPFWSQKTFDERRDYLSRFADAIQSKLDELATVLTLETGKPLAAAKGEITVGIAIIRQLISLEIKPETLRDDASGKAEIRYKPLGVVGGIAPWNVPIILATPKITSALYTGNAMVLKPSPYTPLATLMLGEIACSIFPPGVLNIVAGGNDLGSWMTAHPGIDMITFTGSVATGKRVMASAAANMKRLILELGGNDAAIVLNDVDPKAIAPRLFHAAFANSGQVCQAIKRLYVHEDVYEPLLDELVAIAKHVKVGDGLEEGVNFGPVQNKAQYEQVLEILQDTAGRPGVRIMVGGGPIDRPGYYIEPTIVADISEGTRLVDEEPFGPVLPVIRYSDIDDVICRANNTRFGLGGSVWTKDVEKGAEIAGRLESGVAWVNHHLGVSAEYPFGGVKESGIGRANGLMGLRGNMEPQLVILPASVS